VIPQPSRHARYAVMRLLACLLAILLIPACSGFGPRALESSRTRYNIAIQGTDSQQQLLNLVRLRYRDTPFFLQLSSVSSNLRFRAAVGAGGQIASGGPDIASVDGSSAVEESPTMTYTPLQGGKFVKQMLEPVDLGILFSGGSARLPNRSRRCNPVPPRAPRRF